MSEWLIKLWYIQTLNATQRKKTQAHSSLNEYLENYVEKSQSQKFTECMILFVHHYRHDKILKIREQISGCWDLRRWEQKVGVAVKKATGEIFINCSFHGCINVRILVVMLYYSFIKW